MKTTWAAGAFAKPVLYIVSHSRYARNLYRISSLTVNMPETCTVYHLLQSICLKPVLYIISYSHYVWNLYCISSLSYYVWNLYHISSLTVNMPETCTVYRLLQSLCPKPVLYIASYSHYAKLLLDFSPYYKVIIWFI